MYLHKIVQVIRKPVDIAKIQKRIDEEYYEDMDALEKVRVLYLFVWWIQKDVWCDYAQGKLKYLI